MSYKYILNKNFPQCQELVVHIKEYFSKGDATIHKARNELKIINFATLNVVVKSFKIPNLINQVVYSFFRDSKAKKSYEFSLRIKEFTPQPIGYIEFYTLGLLQESYFISEHFKYDFTIREPLTQSGFAEKEKLFKCFAKFTFDLHEAGILHLDYSPGNILIKQENDTYLFKIVDINRMEFKKLSLDERLKNFKMLWAKDEDMKIIAKEYARLMDVDEELCVQTAIRYSQKNKDFKNMKKRIKGKKVVD